MKALETVFHGPTNYRGSRITATDNDGNSVTVPYDHAVNPEENHRFAVFNLCEKMKWSGTLAEGGTKRGYVFVWVAANGHNTFAVDTTLAKD